MTEPTEEMDAVDALRFQAFKTNSIADMDAYRDAACKFFQSESDRRLARSYVNEQNLREARDAGFADGTSHQKKRTE